MHQAASLYTSLSRKLTGQVKQYIRLCRIALLPYILELLDKEDAGHDCRNCASSCTIRHTAQIWGIKDAHTQMTGTLQRLQAVAMPVHHESLHADEYRMLRSEMLHLDKTLKTLFGLDESSLIPKVMEAQKNIHAHS